MKYKLLVIVTIFLLRGDFVLTQSQSSRTTPPVCDGRVRFGLSPYDFPDDYPNDTLLSLHKDITIGVWFEAPYSGPIDTIFWEVRNVPDTVIIYVRGHRSYVTPTSGPGNSPYPSPPTPWGYWINSNDTLNGIDAFEEDTINTS